MLPPEVVVQPHEMPCPQVGPEDVGKRPPRVFPMVERAGQDRTPVA